VVLRFGAFTLDTGRYELRGPAGPVHVEPQVFDVLLYLLQHRDRVVSKTELLEQLWGSRFVSESTPHQPDQGGPAGDRRRR
jgi:DNA-binding winged helix-turn-helix (wHTH) protein